MKFINYNMVEDKIVGRYWLCRNESGSLWLVQGRKPIQDGGGYMADYDIGSMPWLELTNEYDCSIKDEVEVKSSDYAGLNFPSITYEDGAIEIEICKSGKVYWYES